MAKSETVQFFQFNSSGNMYVFPAGSGCTGVPKLVRPGEDITFDNKSENDEISQFSDSGVCSLESVKSADSLQVVSALCSFQSSQGQRTFNVPLKSDVLEKLSKKKLCPRDCQEDKLGCENVQRLEKL